MVFRNFLIFSFLAGISVIPLSVASQENNQAIIDIINKQIESATSKKELAKLYSHRARQYVKLGDYGAGEKDYLTAIEHDMSGWLVKEFGYFLYKDGQFEKAAKLAYNLERKFPGLADDARKLSKLAKAKYQEEYYKKNPPTIDINVDYNPDRVTRLQLIKQTKAETAVRKYNNIILSQCQDEWGTDYRMVEYCIKKQRESRTAVSGYRENEIMKRCKNEWGTDYRMVEYCLKKQTSAKASVSRKGTGIIKNSCQKKWGDDYRMVEYCIKKQSEARRSIKKSSSNKRGRCEQKWGTDYQMVEYCIKN